MIRMVSTLIKKLKLLTLPKKRRIYVVLHGQYKGEWWVRVKPDTYFSLPDKYIRTVTVKDWEEGISKNIIEPVDVLPEKVYNVCLAEYNYKATDEQRNNALNRREQHPSSDSLDSE